MDSLKLLWHSAYWDGPIDGLLNYQGKKYWFQRFDEPSDRIVFRRFLIIELSPDQLSEEEYWHELFRQKVGTHADYDETGRRQSYVIHPEELHNEFYDAYKNRLALDLSDNRLIGWFER